MQINHSISFTLLKWIFYVPLPQKSKMNTRNSLWVEDSHFKMAAQFILFPTASWALHYSLEVFALGVAITGLLLSVGFPGHAGDLEGNFPKTRSLWGVPTSLTPVCLHKYKFAIWHPCHVCSVSKSFATLITPGTRYPVKNQSSFCVIHHSFLQSPSAFWLGNEAER